MPQLRTLRYLLRPSGTGPECTALLPLAKSVPHCYERPRQYLTNTDQDCTALLPGARGSLRPLRPPRDLFGSRSVPGSQSVPRHARYRPKRRTRGACQ
eukprot:2593190-Rhodomonas_salina.1